MVKRNIRTRLVELVPRSLLVLVAEIGGACSVQRDVPDEGRPHEWKWLSRLRCLLNKENRTSPHTLFDPRYYLENNTDVQGSQWSPLLHFLLWGGFEGRKPHPLFDPEWYMAQYPEVASCGLNPLQHYIRFGQREGRSPHQ